MVNITPIIELAQKLILIPSETDRLDELKKIIDFVEDYLNVEGIILRRYEMNGYHSLVATFEETKHPECLMVGHLDVVASKEEGYLPKIVDDRLYGRGSGDMKTACAVMIEIFKSFADKSSKPSLGLMLNTDEEIGGLDGVHYLLQKEEYLADVVFVPDSGSGLEKLVNQQKGFTLVKMWAEGHSAHGSRPYLGENAIEKLMKHYLNLRQAILVAKNDEDWGNTINLGKINGGGSINQIPDYAELFLDIRFVTPEDIEKIIGEIKHISKGQYDILVKGFPVMIEEDNEWVQKYLKQVKNVANIDVEFKRERGTCDARFFTQKGVPAIISGINKGNIHGDHEWVDLEEVETFKKVLWQFIEEEVTKI